MVYNIVYKKSVYRDIKKLSKTETKRILDLIETELVKKPESDPTLKGQFAGLRKCRIGDHRVIYTLLGLDILSIGNRKDVYKSEIQSGSRGCFSPSPHTTRHADPHRAVHVSYRAVAG